MAKAFLRKNESMQLTKRIEQAITNDPQATTLMLSERFDVSRRTIQTIGKRLGRPFVRCCLDDGTCEGEKQ